MVSFGLYKLVCKNTQGRIHTLFKNLYDLLSTHVGYHGETVPEAAMFLAIAWSPEASLVHIIHMRERERGGERESQFLWNVFQALVGGL